MSVNTILLGGSIQGNSLSLTTAVSTFAGSGTRGATDATGTLATFSDPVGICTDGSNLYVADASNNKIRKIVIASGAVTTLAGSGTAGAVDAIGTAASFYQPATCTTDGINLYIADAINHKIRKIVIASGLVSTVAGTGTAGAVDATGTAASFNIPYGITTDGTNLYVTDRSNNKIRKIVIASGVVTTLAGSGTAGAVDATGTAASFNFLLDITTDGTNLYVADSYNQKIRKIVIASGVVTTLAGSGSTGAVDATGTAASFNVPTGITTDGSNLYVTDRVNYKIRKIVISSGVVTTVAGSGNIGAVDATGTAASFSNLFGITTDGSNLYMGDLGNQNIRKIQ